MELKIGELYKIDSGDIKQNEFVITKPYCGFHYDFNVTNHYKNGSIVLVLDTDKTVKDIDVSVGLFEDGKIWSIFNVRLKKL